MNGSVSRTCSHQSAWEAGGIRATLVAVLAAAVLLLPVAAQAAPAVSTIASTGDSITRAYNTGAFPFSDNPAGSWSTGTNTTVNSHLLRLRSSNPAIVAFNDAKSGAKMADLNGQMATVVAQHADYVTVLMGGNDVCTSSPATMTSVDSFTTQFRTAMDKVTVSRSNAGVRVYVASIPSVSRLWTVLKGSGSARFFWSLFSVCQSMLKNPLSTAAADVQRREAVEQRDRDFNTALETVCTEYVVQCRFDGNAVYNYAFSAADISTRDYFHPSLTGQKNIAATTWTAFWGP